MEEKKVFVKDIFKLQSDVEILQGLFSYEISNCSTSTKTINVGETFFAIEKGNDYVEEAMKNGASCCIVEQVIDEKILQKYPKVTVVKVKNSLKTLQNLASYKRKLYNNIPVIAITGSVGKTSTKDIIANVVSAKYNVLKTEGNFNNHIGLPLTILKLRDHNAIVLEMGMNHFHEIEVLSQIAKPNIAVITNIGTSHIGILGSQRNIMKAKLEILNGLQENGILIINNDNELLKNWNEKENKSNSFEVMTYGINENSSVIAQDVEYTEEKSVYNVKSKKIYGEIQVPIHGEPFVYNSLAAIAVANILDIEYKEVFNAIKTFELTKKRMEIKDIDNVKYINDAYNASFESMKYAIKYLDNMEGQRKIAILGDMFELGDFTEELHRKVGKEVDKSNINILITAGEYSKYIDDEVHNVEFKIHLKNKEEVVKKLNQIKQAGDVILLKASNGMKFYEIIDMLK